MTTVVGLYKTTAKRAKHLLPITKICLFKYIENFTTKKKKKKKIQIKNSDIFHISAQNIDCEYSLERF